MARASRPPVTVSTVPPGPLAVGSAVTITRHNGRATQRVIRMIENELLELDVTTSDGQHPGVSIVELEPSPRGTILRQSFGSYVPGAHSRRLADFFTVLMLPFLYVLIRRQMFRLRSFIEADARQG